jgi:N-acetylneuraminate synthase
MKIIAEIGSNWKTYSDLYIGIDKAKDAGADAVKFQMFSGKELYGFDVESLDTFALDISQIKSLKSYADDAGVEFMCSAFSIRGYRHINKLVQTHKIASSEAHWPGLVKEVLSFNKPTIISTGGLSRCQIRDIVEMAKGKNLTLLYCDPTYPSNKGVNMVLKGMEILSNYGVDIGLSDHSLDVTLDDSILSDCSVIEKHYNPFGLTGTPDAGHSLDHAQFTAFVEHCRSAGTWFTENKHARVKTSKGWYRPHFKG